MAENHKDKISQKPRGLWKRILESVVGTRPDDSPTSNEISDEAKPVSQPQIETQSAVNEITDINLSWQAEDFHVEEVAVVEDPWCEDFSDENSTISTTDMCIEKLIADYGIDEAIVLETANLPSAPQQENGVVQPRKPPVMMDRQAVDVHVEAGSYQDPETVVDCQPSFKGQQPKVTEHKKSEILNDMMDIISGMIKKLDSLRNEPNPFKSNVRVSVTVTKELEHPAVENEYSEPELASEPENYEEIEPLADEEGSVTPVYPKVIVANIFNDESDEHWTQNSSEEDEFDLFEEPEKPKSSSNEKTREDDEEELTQYSAEWSIWIDNLVNKEKIVDDEEDLSTVCLNEEYDDYDDFDIFEYEEDVSESPWENYEISSPSLSNARDKAAEIVSLLSLVTEREQLAALDYLDEFFLNRSAASTYREIYKIAVSGIDFSSLRDTIILRDTWEDHPEWRIYKKYNRSSRQWTVSYKLQNISWLNCRKIVCNRSHYPPEHMVPSEWYDEWQYLPAGHELYFNFVNFVLFKASESERDDFHTAFAEYYKQGNLSDMNDNRNWRNYVRNGDLCPEEYTHAIQN